MNFAICSSSYWLPNGPPSGAEKGRPWKAAPQLSCTLSGVGGRCRRSATAETARPRLGSDKVTARRQGQSRRRAGNTLYRESESRGLPSQPVGCPKDTIPSFFGANLNPAAAASPRRSGARQSAPSKGSRPVQWLPTGRRVRRRLRSREDPLRPRCGTSQTAGA